MPWLSQSPDLNTPLTQKFGAATETAFSSNHHHSKFLKEEWSHILPIEFQILALVVWSDNTICVDLSFTILADTCIFTSVFPTGSQSQVYLWWLPNGKRGTELTQDKGLRLGVWILVHKLNVEAS